MQRSPEIEELVTAWFAAATSGDPSLVATRVCQDEDTRLIGSAPTELFKGGLAVSEYLNGELEGAAGKVTFATSDTEAFAEGSVGWATSNVTITMPDGKCINPRWSAVLHRESGVWMFVQIHASIGVANDTIGWVYPD